MQNEEDGVWSLGSPLVIEISAQSSASVPFTGSESVAGSRGGGARGRQRRPGQARSASAGTRLARTALGRLFILNPYRVGVNSSDFIPALDNVIV